MNILPIVFAFMLIFSLISVGFMHEHIFTTLTEKNIHSFYKTSTAVKNAIADKHYRRIKKESSSSKPQTSSQTIKSNKEYFSRRDMFPPMEDSKFNLTALLETKTDFKTHPLYETCARFMHILYEPLFKEAKRDSLEYALLDAMIKTAHKTEVKQLSDLYPSSPELHSIFYKMLKGTNQYKVLEKKGIPPLEDFFCLGKSESIHFAFASTPLLEALLGKKMATRIALEEKKKWEATGKQTSLTQEDLTALLVTDPVHSTFILQLGTHLSFSQKMSKRFLLAGRDKTSGLAVRKEF